MFAFILLLLLTEFCIINCTIQPYTSNLLILLIIYEDCIHLYYVEIYICTPHLYFHNFCCGWINVTQTNLFIFTLDNYTHHLYIFVLHYTCMVINSTFCSYTYIIHIAENTNSLK